MADMARDKVELRLDDIKMVQRGLTGLHSDPKVGSAIEGVLNGVAAVANAMAETPNTKRGENYGYEVSMWEPESRAGGRVTAVGPTARRRNADSNVLAKAMDQNRRLT